MIRFVLRFLLAIASNGVAILGAAYFVSGFSFTGDIRELAIAAVLLTAINTFIRPLLRLILTPVIFLTLGLGVVALNAGILYILDVFLEPIMISGLLPLLIATFIISIVNIVLSIIRSSFRMG